MTTGGAHPCHGVPRSAATATPAVADTIRDTNTATADKEQAAVSAQTAPWPNLAAPAQPWEDVLSDPNTSETLILTHGLHTLGEMLAASARTPKGPALIRAIIDDTARATWIPDDTISQILDQLLTEDALTAADLRSVAAAARSIGSRHTVVAAISHRLAGNAIVMNTLWGASWDAAQEAGRSCGTLLPAATWWVRTSLARTGCWNKIHATPGFAQCDTILTLAARWEHATREEPALAAFIRCAAGNFTDENTMFAAGRGLCAPAACTTTTAKPHAGPLPPQHQSAQ